MAEVEGYHNLSDDDSNTLKKEIKMDKAVKTKSGTNFKDFMRMKI